MIGRLFGAALFGVLPAVAQATPNTCIDTYRIDHTDIPDDSAILFVMRDHSVYRAKIIGSCIGLHLNTRGFTYAPNPGTEDICSNLLTIRVNDTGAYCMVGQIDQVKPPRR